MGFAIHMIDVFGSRPLSGNPLAVVIGADALSTDEMQGLTRWFNLSETTFLLQPTHPQADYRVRIFSLDRELPFAGHPTLGSCHAWLSANGMAKNQTAIVQECGAGLVTIRRSHGRLCFAAPPLIRSGAPTPAELEEARQLLRIEACDIIDAAWIDNGPGWLGIRLASAEKVLGLDPARNWPGRIDIGVVGPHVQGGETAFGFAPSSTIIWASSSKTPSPEASTPRWRNGCSRRAWLAKTMSRRRERALAAMVAST